MSTIKITQNSKHIIERHILCVMQVIVLVRNQKMYLLQKRCCSNIKGNAIENIKEIKIKGYKIFYWGSTKPQNNNIFNSMVSAAICSDNLQYSKDSKKCRNKSTTISSQTFANFTLKCVKIIFTQNRKILQRE